MNWFQMFLTASIDPTQTPEFQQWFGPSKTVDEDGRPLQLYHGTTHTFDQFKLNKSSHESYFGQGFYFSNTPDDTNENYAGEGPDLTNRITQLAENILSEKWQKSPLKEPQYGTPEYKQWQELAKAKARQKLSGGAPKNMPVYVKMHRPFVLDKGAPDETHIEGHYQEDREGNIIGIGGEVGRLLRSINRVATKYGLDGDKVQGDFEERIGGIDWMSAAQIYESLKSIEDIQQADDNYGRLVADQIIRDIIKGAGFDGVIMNADTAFGHSRKDGRPMKGVNPGTRHYIVWHPAQIKSSIGNRTFNPKSKRITE